MIIEDIKRKSSSKRTAPSWSSVLEWRELQRKKIELLAKKQQAAFVWDKKRLKYKKLAWLTVLLIGFQIINLPHIAFGGGGGITPPPRTNVGDGYFNLSIIAANYTSGQLTDFHTAASQLESYLLNTEPYKSRSAQIRFQIVDNTADLGCQVQQGQVGTINITGIYCSNNLVEDAVNTNNTAWDKIAIIYNSTDYVGDAGVGSDIALVTSSATDAITHELGHTFTLNDEYNYGTTFTSSNDEVNCYPGTPPASQWDGLVGSQDYYQACGFSNWYKPSQGSIMEGYVGANTFYNAVSLRIVNEKLDYYAAPYSGTGTLVDTTVSSPSNGFTPSGTISITPTYSELSTVQRAEIWVNGSLFHTTYVSPFTFSLSSSSLNQNPSTIEIKAYNGLGKHGGVATLITSGGVASPTISNIQYAEQNGTPYLKWTTNEPSTTSARYGQTTSYGVTTPTTDTQTLTTIHSLELSGLKPSTTYHITAFSLNQSGNETTSNDFTFTTGTAVFAPDITSAGAASNNINGVAISYVGSLPSAAAGGVFVGVSPSLTTSHPVATTETFIKEYQILTTDISGNPVTNGFNAQVTFDYPEGIDSTEAKYTILYWDGSRWSNNGISNINTDTTSNKITFLTNHFSDFAIFINNPVTSSGNNGNSNGQNNSSSIVTKSTSQTLPDAGSNSFDVLVNLLLAVVFYLISIVYVSTIKRLKRCNGGA